MEFAPQGERARIGLSSDIVRRPLTAGEPACDRPAASQRLMAPGVGRRCRLPRLCHRRLCTTRAPPAQSAGQTRRRLPQLRAQGGQDHQGHGGTLPVGLRVCRRTKGPPHLGQRGAAVGALTAPPCPRVLLVTARLPRPRLARLRRGRWPGLRTPSERPVTQRCGSPGWSNRRMHSSAGTVHVVPCAVADAVDCKVPWPSASVRRRFFLMATRQRSGARERKASWPLPPGALSCPCG